MTELTGCSNVVIVTYPYLTCVNLFLKRGRPLDIFSFFHRPNLSDSVVRTVLLPSPSSSVY